ncbi:Menaquinone via futalosine steps 3 and 5, possible alternative [Candidatus Syntrophocurvum alkaliphilum]|uniref:Menaquinone via futalosine steps 3 and 5, possible alternative n=1 Tax=Candidatus Syntrophocurvum alkaliphilum TaxID=2293317 RepID=A0A6I6DFA3_9FIRM|nr:MTAP family purine nucleoside phosphorylase [Candidatus Syntrophocurvum alkaliphilum]QGT99314.1 Menaquinone via futalosine steps 3 and 5, possible alternative [Candidatus Syntrophocurvum alkaliphilum]
MSIPQCDIAFIGGSSTLNVNIPDELDLDFVEVIDTNLVFETPFGKSPEFKRLVIFNEDEKRYVLCCRMHGWRRGVNRADASRQIFWVFKQAGVKKILAEGGVGAINYLLKPRDIIIPHDYMDFSIRKDVGLEDKYLLVMRDALCPETRDLIYKNANEVWEEKVFDRSIYVNTDGRHFESPAEINMFKIGGGDVVGQSICPEVYLAREIGACYAGIYLVVNYAEGIVSPWQHEELAEIFYTEGYALGKIIFNTLKDVKIKGGCGCKDLRKETLLKGIY